MTAWDDNTHRLANGGMPFSGHSTRDGWNIGGISSASNNEERNDIMSSLKSINGQLGELLSRLGPQPSSSAAAVTTHPYSRYTPSPATLAVRDVGNGR